MFFLIIPCITSCNESFKKYKNEVDASYLLVQNVKVNNYLFIKSSIGLELKNIALNDEILKFNVNKLYKILLNFDLGNIEFAEYLPNSPHKVDVIIHLKNKGEQKKYRIVVKFEKYLEIGKIYNFNLFQSEDQIF